jgi:hypothetical protein
MKQSTESRHLDWELRTVVGIDNPDDWKPGDPDRYFVRGIATLAHDGDKFGYSSEDPISLDGAHFTDPSLARRYHGEATMRLQELINGLVLE